MNIAGIPGHIIFAGNMPEVTLSGVAAESVNVQFYETSTPQTLILDETYFPDASREISIDLKSVLAELLVSGLPRSSAFYYTPTDIVHSYTLSVNNTLYTFQVVNGGIEPEEDTPTFLRHNFLTWRQGTRRVSSGSPVFLHYIAQEDCLYKITARFDDGGESPLAIALFDGEIKCFNLSPAKLRAIFNKNITGCSAWIESHSGYHLTDIVNVEVSELPDTAREYFYANSLGGFDTITCTGKLERKIKTESALVALGGKTHEANIDHTSAYVQNTGYLTPSDSELTADFLLSKSRFLVSAGQLIPIIIEDTDNTFTEFSLNSFEFEYRFPEQSRYRHVPHKEGLTAGQLPPFPSKIGACFDQKKGRQVIDRTRGYIATISEDGNYIDFPILIPDVMRKANTAFWLSGIPVEESARRWKITEITGTHTINYATGLCSDTLFFRDFSGTIASTLPIIVYKTPLSEIEAGQVLKYLEEYYFLEDQDDNTLIVDNVPQEGNNTFLIDTLKIQ